MASLSVEEDHHDDYDLNQHFSLNGPKKWSSLPIISEQEQLRQRVFTSTTRSTKPISDSPIQSPQQPLQSPRPSQPPPAARVTPTTCFAKFIYRLQCQSELLRVDSTRQKNLEVLVLSFFFITIYILTILMLRYSLHQEVGVYRHYFFGFIVFFLTPATNYFLGKKQNKSFNAVQAFEGGRPFIALQGFAWFFYGCSLSAALYVLFAGLSAVSSTFLAVIFLFAILAQIFVMVSINYFKAESDRRKYLPSFIEHLHKGFFPSLAKTSSASPKISPEFPKLPDIKDMEPTEFDEELDNLVGDLQPNRLVTTRSNRLTSSAVATPSAAKNKSFTSDAIYENVELIVPDEEQDTLITKEPYPPLPRLADSMDSSEPIASETITVTDIAWLQRVIDVLLVGFLYHTPLFGGLFIAFPIFAIFQFGLIHPITTLIFVFQTYYYFNLLGDAHISGEKSSRILRDPKSPLWQSTLRYFDARTIICSHDDLDRARIQSIDALALIRKIIIPAHIDELLVDIVPDQCDVQGSSSISPSKCHLSFSYPSSTPTSPASPTPPTTQTTSLSKDPNSPKITLTLPSTPSVSGPLSPSHPTSSNENQIIINYDEIATHESLGLNIPYLFYMVGPSRFNMLHEQAALRGVHFKPTYEDLTFSHPDLILTNTKLELNPLPPLSLIKLLQQSTYSMVATHSNSALFAHHPHGIYPLSCFWSHKHSAFTKVFTNRLHEHLKRNPRLKYRVRYLPDFFGNLHPAFHRYQCILHDSSTQFPTPSLLDSLPASPSSQSSTSVPASPSSSLSSYKEGNEEFDDDFLTDENIKAHFEDNYLPPVLTAHQSKYPHAANQVHLPVDVDTLGASVLSHTPSLREVFLSSGGCDVSKDSLLLRVSVNRSVILVPSGQKDMLYSRSDDINFVFYTQHLGFIKLALTCGLPLVPIICFGENQVLSTFSFAPLQLLIYKLTRVFLPLYPHGPLLSLWPNPISLTMVFGDPIYLPVINKPTDEIVRFYHNVFYTHIARLFFCHREAAGFPDSTLRFF